MREITVFCPTIGGVEKNLYLILNYLVKKIKVNLLTCSLIKKFL